jgi:hypothetical protein
VQHRDLLLGGEPAQEVVGALTERQSRITVANRFDCNPPRSEAYDLDMITAG